MKNGLKISVLGAGNVGATIAYTLTLDGMSSEIAIIDINKEKAEGEALDIVQGTPLTSPVNVYSGDFSDAVNSDIVVVAAGMGRKPGMTRIDLAQNNVNIMKQMMPEVVKYAPNAIYVIVSNPVDILTYVVSKISGLPKNQIIGSGTHLDTARLRTCVAQKLGINPHNVNAYVLGEHGDTSVVPWSIAKIAGMDINSYCKSAGIAASVHSPEALAAIEKDMRTSGSQVISKKGATFYAVSMSVSNICEAIKNNVSTIQTVSTMMEGEYGTNDICLSLPCLIGANGIERTVTPKLTAAEEDLFRKSAAALTEVKNSIKF